MREVDFLPGWYPAIQKRYSQVMLQAWTTLAILVLLTGYAIWQRAKLNIAGRITEQSEMQLRVSREQLAKLTGKVKYEQELRQKDQILAQLGSGVDSTRVLKALEDAMTPEMALTNFSMETQELPPAVQLTAISSPRQTGQGSDQRLRVIVDGVAPSDAEIATFMGHLQHFGCFDNVAFPYLREGRSSDGHVLREFEVTFDVNLNGSGEGRP